MPGIRDLIAGISSGTRNLVQRIPGGSRAFPLEANGTVNWLGDPTSGNNVVGAIGRDLSGYGMVEGLIGGGIDDSGSVVRMGYVGSGGRGSNDRFHPSQYGPRRSDALPRANVIRDQDSISGGGFESRTNPRVGNPSAADVVGEDSGPRPMRGGRGGYNGRSISLARGLGEGQRRTGDQAMQEALDMEARMRARGGLLAER